MCKNIFLSNNIEGKYLDIVIVKKYSKNINIKN